jgi:prepilin-type N-terminal cleavage/methylation domain-containing protein
MYQNNFFIYHRAFSLLELALVVLIISILSSAAIIGTNLINRAKLRLIINDYNVYKNAFNTFYATYDVKAGDMSPEDSLKFFGVANYTYNCATSSYNDMVLSASDEGLIAFSHLNLAELIFGKYDGLFLQEEKPGVTVGRSRYDDELGFSFFSINAGCNKWLYEERSIYKKNNKTILVFGKKDAEDTILANSAVKPIDAYSIDNKLDNGIPNSGRFLADHGSDVGNNAQCTSLNGVNASFYKQTDGDLSYMLDHNYAACRLMFIIDL